MHIIARRGVTTKNVPSNTLDAVILSQALSYIDGITLDVRLTMDNQLVVFERDSIESLSNGKGNISEMTLDELKHYNTGTKIHKQSIITLEEALSEIDLEMEHKILLHLCDHASKNEILVDELLKVLAKFPSLNILIASCELSMLLLLKEKKISYPLGRIFKFKEDYNYKMDLSFYVIPLYLINKDFIQTSLQNNKEIFIYPVNTQEEFDSLKELLGSDIENVYLITDRVKIIS